MLRELSPMEEDLKAIFQLGRTEGPDDVGEQDNVKKMVTRRTADVTNDGHTEIPSWIILKQSGPKVDKGWKNTKGTCGS